MDRAPVAGGVGVFAGEEEGVFDGSGHAGGGLGAADADVAVGAEEVWIRRPVVGEAALKQIVEVRRGLVEDAGEGAAA